MSSSEVCRFCISSAYYPTSIGLDAIKTQNPRMSNRFDPSSMAASLTPLLFLVQSDLFPSVGLESFNVHYILFQACSRDVGCDRPRSAINAEYDRAFVRDVTAQSAI